MRKNLFKFHLLLLAFGLFGRFAMAQTTTLNFTHNQPAELTADAGTDETLCVDSTVTLGGNPTAGGGTSPFTYDWSPTADLSSSTVANPDVTPVAMGSTDYSVEVTDARGCMALDTVEVTADTSCNPSAVAVIAGVGSSTVFPNPTSGNFTVDVKLLNNATQATISVVSMEGKMVFTRNVSPERKRIREEIKLSGVSKGTYMVNITIEGAVLSHQLIVQ